MAVAPSNGHVDVATLSNGGGGDVIDVAKSDEAEQHPEVVEAGNRNRRWN